MTIEELAVVSQREFESIRNEMATREELKTIEQTILRAVEGLGFQLAGYASRWSDEFDRLSDRIQDIGNRVNRQER